MSTGDVMICTSDINTKHIQSFGLIDKLLTVTMSYCLMLLRWFPVSGDSVQCHQDKRDGDIIQTFCLNLLVIFCLCVSNNNLVGLLSQTDVIVSKCHLYVNLQDD